MAIHVRPPEPMPSVIGMGIRKIIKTTDIVSVVMWSVLILMVPFLLAGRRVSWELYLILVILASVKVYRYVDGKRTGTDK